jgi:hypothetical protein
MRVIVTLVLIAALPATAVHAQDRAQPSAPPSGTAPKAGAASPPSSPARDLSRVLLPEARWDRLLDGYASSLAAQVSQALVGRGEKVPDDLQSKIRGELGERFQYKDTVDTQASALQKHLTPDEMKKTAAFYSTATGKKVIEKVPEAQAELGEDLQTRLTAAVPEIVQKLAPAALAPPPDGAHGSGERGKEPPPVQGRRPPEGDSRSR